MADIAGGEDPGAGFVALMGRAAEQADAQAPEAPYGYTRDRQTGETRPKKSPGRAGARTPSVDDLKASEPAAARPPGAEDGGGAGDEPAPVDPVPPPADVAPDEKRTKARIRRSGSDKPASPVPQYRAGVITTGINRLYRRAGKVVRAMDADIGEAIIQSARNAADPGEPDDSVGAAWEELARTNPRIRKFVMKALTGGAWTQLVMAHAPIAMAIMMKPAILRFIPFATLIESVAEPDEDTPEGEGGLPGGMTATDVDQMTQLATAQMAKMGMSLPPEAMAQMAQMASGMMGGPPPATVRSQPRRPASRADRRGS